MSTIEHQPKCSLMAIISMNLSAVVRLHIKENFGSGLSTMYSKP